MTVFENAKPLEGHKESGDAAKAASQERGSNLSVLNGSEGSRSAGTWLENRLIQTKRKLQNPAMSLSWLLREKMNLRAIM